ncbi:hypothetical protein Bca101_059260 [Brassica carinata]
MPKAKNVLDLEACAGGGFFLRSVTRGMACGAYPARGWFTVPLEFTLQRRTRGKKVDFVRRIVFCVSSLPDPVMCHLWHCWREEGRCFIPIKWNHDVDSIAPYRRSCSFGSRRQSVRALGFSEWSPAEFRGSVVNP